MPRTSTTRTITERGAPRFSLRAALDPAVAALVARTPPAVLARWAIACTRRVLPWFARARPADPRPADALATLARWVRTGRFAMAEIRGAALAAHAAARSLPETSAARSAARSAGQAVATAHVPAHALAAALYALQAVHRAAAPARAVDAVTGERAWQVRRLRALRAARRRR